LIPYGRAQRAALGGLFLFIIVLSRTHEVSTRCVEAERRRRHLSGPVDQNTSPGVCTPGVV